MIDSEQSKDLGPEWFTKLQAEVSAVPADGLDQFRASIKPDEMGPDGKEGIDDDK